jgi:hypothetical protein
VEFRYGVFIGDSTGQANFSMDFDSERLLDLF